MKIKLWTKYNVGYLPSSRCRKLRYKEEEEFIDININEVTKNNLIPAFDTGIIIYSYDNKFWREATENDIHCVNENNSMTALEALIDCGLRCSTYFGRYKGCITNKNYYDDSNREQREEVLARAEKDMSNYLIVDGILYTTTSEPMYCIYTFGLGNNHAGIGTSLSIVNYYNSNISNKAYFNALEYEKALDKALKTALNRGDTDSIDYIKKLSPIKIFDTKFVTREPRKDHIE